MKQATRLESDRAHALREAIMSVKNGGIVSVVGVYGGLVDKFPLGAVVNRSPHDQGGPVPRLFRRKQDDCVKVLSP